jgi:hypothetical protein
VLHRVVEVDRDGTVRTKGDANAVVDSSAVDAGRITGVGQVLVPRAGLPVLWWRHGEWLALAAFAAITLGALGVTRYALLEAHDPWRVESQPIPARPPLPAAARQAIDRFRDEVARDGPVLVSRRLVLRRGAELTALGLGVAFLASSRTAWATFADTTGNGTNTFGATALAGPTGLARTAVGCGGTSGIVFEGATSATNTANGATVTVPRPLGAQVGHLLVAQVAFHTRNFSGTITAPSGWTTVRVDDDAGNTMQATFWKVAGSSEPSSYTFTNTTGDTTRTGAGGIAAYSGVDTTSPIDAHGATTYPGNVTALTAPSLTTSVAGARLLTLVAQRSDGPITPSSGMAERLEVSASNQNVLELADQALAAAGATGTRTATSGANRSGVAQAVALRPRQVALVGTGATGTALNGATGTLTLPRPSGVAADDVLIAHVVLHTHGFAPNPIQAPSGWHEIRVDTDANHVTAGVFWRRAGGSEPSSYTFTNNSGDTTQQAVGAILAYRGLDPAAPVDAHAGTADPSGVDDVVTPSVTTTAPTTRLLSLVGAYGNNQGPAAPPGGMTERYEGTVVSESSVIEILGQAADQVVSTAGATGARTTSVPSTGSSVAQAVALRPPTGEPYVDLTWTPSTSPDVDGYVIERRIGSTVDATATIPSGGASSYTDGPLVPGTTYTYRVIATAGTWRSSPVTTTFTPGAC